MNLLIYNGSSLHLQQIKGYCSDDSFSNSYSSKQLSNKSGLM